MKSKSPHWYDLKLSEAILIVLSSRFDYGSCRGKSRTSLMASFPPVSQLLFLVAKGLYSFPVYVLEILYGHGFCKTLIKLTRLNSLDI